jgi:hypothetical protein
MQRCELGHEIGNISAVAFNFIMHDPSGIIEVVSERSRFQSAEIAQHFRFGVVRVENGVGEEG